MARKTITMLVTVSAPKDMSSADARKEVRYYINNEGNAGWATNEGEVKAKAVKPFPASSN